MNVDISCDFSIEFKALPKNYDEAPFSCVYFTKLLETFLCLEIKSTITDEVFAFWLQSFRHRQKEII